MRGPFSVAAVWQCFWKSYGVLGDVVTRVYLAFYFAMFSDNLSISYSISIILAHRLFLGYSSTQY